jgi:hypothetical protein
VLVLHYWRNSGVLCHLGDAGEALLIFLGVGSAGLQLQTEDSSVQQVLKVCLQALCMAEWFCKVHACAVCGADMCLPSL